MSGSETQQNFVKGVGGTAGGFQSTHESRGHIDNVLAAWKCPELRPSLEHFFAQSEENREVLREGYEQWDALLDDAWNELDEEERTRIAADPTVLPLPRDIDPFRPLQLPLPPAFIPDDFLDEVDWCAPLSSSPPLASPSATLANTDPFASLNDTFVVTPVESVADADETVVDFDEELAAVDARMTGSSEEPALVDNLRNHQFDDDDDEGFVVDGEMDPRFDPDGEGLDADGLNLEMGTFDGKPLDDGFFGGACDGDEMLADDEAPEYDGFDYGEDRAHDYNAHDYGAHDYGAHDYGAFDEDCAFDENGEFAEAASAEGAAAVGEHNGSDECAVDEIGNGEHRQGGFGAYDEDDDDLYAPPTPGHANDFRTASATSAAPAPQRAPPPPRTYGKGAQLSLTPAATDPSALSSDALRPPSPALSLRSNASSSLPPLTPSPPPSPLKGLRFRRLSRHEIEEAELATLRAAQEHEARIAEFEAQAARQREDARERLAREDAWAATRARRAAGGGQA
ncbi:hypothetical protein JCM10450v2_004701 [Rhodotorula kratochvilovae]